VSEPRLSCELVPQTAWWSNVRSNVSRASWEKCKAYSKTKTNGVCIICGQTGMQQGWRYPVEAHEVWQYDDDNLVQTLVDIVPLCPRCHQCKHIGRSRENMDRQQWAQLIDHFRAVNNWDDWRVERYLKLMFQIWELRSGMEWRLDVSFLEREVGLDLSGRQLERQ